jgi:hypothetical protein
MGGWRHEDDTDEADAAAGGTEQGVGGGGDGSVAGPPVRLGGQG